MSKNFKKHKKRSLSPGEILRRINNIPGTSLCEIIEDPSEVSPNRNATYIRWFFGNTQEKEFIAFRYKDWNYTVLRRQAKVIWSSMYSYNQDSHRAEELTKRIFKK